MNLSSTFSKLATRFRVDFAELAAETAHPGESGGSREEALRRLLADFLPRRAGIGTGFVIDACGGVSNQIDIVIYDRYFGARLEVGYVTYFPCEAVIAVGEVKATITSTEKLREAFANIKSVKQLDRSNLGTNQVVTGPGLHTPEIVQFRPDKNHRDQILGFVFTGKSLTKETLIDELQTWQAATPRQVWPNIYCDYERFVISYETQTLGLTTSAMDATNMYCTEPEEEQNVLVLFAALLAAFVNEAHVARPQYLSYAGIETTHHVDHPLGMGN
jgi:hypothetical protein